MSKHDDFKNYDKRDVRAKIDRITEEVDNQAIRNLETKLRVKDYRDELISNLARLDSHSICPSDLPRCHTDSEYQREHINEVHETHRHEQPQQIHGADCHCSKCCPNPTPNWFMKNKLGILMGILWVAMIVLAIGWSPSGKTFDAIQKSYVELIVDFFKMAIMVLAGVVTIKILKNQE